MINEYFSNLKDDPNRKEGILDLRNDPDRKKLIEKLKISEEILNEALRLNAQFYEKIIKRIAEGDSVYEVYEKYVKFVNNFLRPKYGNEIEKYACYHLFSGSSFKLSSVEYWDFEGKDSIIEKIKELLGSEENK